MAIILFIKVKVAKFAKVLENNVWEYFLYELKKKMLHWLNQP